MRPALAATLLAALALLALGPAPAHAVRARGGFDTLAQLISQIEDNIQSTHRVTEAHFLQQWKRCNATLDALETSMQLKLNELKTANASILQANTNIEQVLQQLQPLRETVVVDRLDLGRVQDKLDKGQRERDEENQLNLAKLSDTNTIISVVSKVLKLLFPEPQTGAASESSQGEFKFAEVLENAAAGIKDQMVAQLLASALQTIKNTARTPENMENLRKLLLLLLTELDHYKQEIDRQEQVAAAQWAPIASDLGKKKLDAETKLNGHLANVAELEKQITANNQTIAASKAVMNGPVARQYKHIKDEYNTQKLICETKKQNFESEKAQRASQNSTLEALTKVVTAQQENRQAIEGIDDIILPQPMGCCKICQGDFVACGDSCVSRDQFTARKCLRGCACDMDDPRMAAAGPLSAPAGSQ